jgi:hypothetical protein
VAFLTYRQAATADNLVEAALACAEAMEKRDSKESIASWLFCEAPMQHTFHSGETYDNSKFSVD